MQHGIRLGNQPGDRLGTTLSLHGTGATANTSPRYVGRRLLLLSLCAWAPPADGFTLAFRVLRNDSQIGTHVLTFAVTAGALTVRVATDIRVGLGPVTFYRYTHRAEERWRDGVFIALDAETNDDGTIGRTTVRREATTLITAGREAPQYHAPTTALPMTHWNRRILDGPLISAQSGKLLRPVVTHLGTTRVATAAEEVAADQYALRGDPDLDTWYDGSGTWTGLRLTARDGSTIRYERG